MNSSFLTPESAMYLNEAITEEKSKVDDEIVYAGLHGDKKKRGKFERTKKYSSRHTKARGQKRRRKGRFG